MSDEALAELALQAGISRAWTDVFGRTHEVAPPTLRAVLASLDLPADSRAAIADSLHRLRQPRSLPPLVTARTGEPVTLACPPATYCLTLEDGRLFQGTSEPHPAGSRLPAILEPGYHRLEIGGRIVTLAVAPHGCFTIPEALGRPRGWGLAVQLYGLRRPGDAGLGDLGALAAFARHAAATGAHAIAISPLHAQFSADPDRFSPYAPSSRTALNVLHAAIDDAALADPAMRAEAARLESLSLVDWPAASRFRLACMRAMFETAMRDETARAALASFRAEAGGALQSHAVFEALHSHLFGGDPALWHWRTWPAPWRDPDSPAVLAFARDHATQVAFHAYLQHLADRGLAQAQAAAREAGMPVGLVSDLAVGADSGGSQCWSRQQETLLGVSVGAPPDLLQRRGQNWGLTAFSPRGLCDHGYATYRDMLRTALAHAGGMRIDHAMGLNRLWVIPDGADGADGAYLSFPEQDLLRLVTLESHRHRAIVLAEDLGTVPEGFTGRLREAGIAGLRVLWFERDQNRNFNAPAHWTRNATAMTSTHDLPTVAGWWTGRDIEWREQLGHTEDGTEERAEREQDRALLWQAFTQSGAAAGPLPEHPSPAVDAALLHVGRSACELVMLPVEDALAATEQPNLPGTLDEHPNWQRRYPGPASRLLEHPAVAGRLAALDRARQEQDP